ncbi:DUF6913 domain-containing protein [Reichenbachiella agariperforans]|uniref:DUF6913 domain-containing protein n=1 Tax=Reichenbachiella agariperforans TaxID=156994 RepID=UPI001C08EADC|nr:hypothetical protein [Reichenbachiella agariperforans]MBU2913482.1 hypothetical protein [Reichenbachiella agariperforans]
MIGKYLVKWKTKFALKHKAKQGSMSYLDAKQLGILYTYTTEKNHELVNDWVKGLEAEGKSVKVITYIPKVKKADSFDYPFFSDRDLGSSGKWKKSEVQSFNETPFDYLITLDKGLNQYTRNLMATAKASCRVGVFAEGESDYFEMMINHDGNDFGALLRQVHHYIKNVRNE